MTTVFVREGKQQVLTALSQGWNYSSLYSSHFTFEGAWWEEARAVPVFLAWPRSQYQECENELLGSPSPFSLRLCGSHHRGALRPPFLQQGSSLGFPLSPQGVLLFPGPGEERECGMATRRKGQVCWRLAREQTLAGALWLWAWGCL